jgi:hypothetical protein
VRGLHLKEINAFVLVLEHFLYRVTWKKGDKNGELFCVIGRSWKGSYGSDCHGKVENGY